ncbi:MAG TPA: hypothetical protein PLV07_09630 [Acidiphilium sp.]|uniref:tetratricopeptide repeat protein n=1 Tax=unclassified Acidiphilium TaxID=2617493 RepID=UPI000BD11C13|nr:MULTISPECIES: hypothetical protein [unclassified Acidiphilium]OYV55794.1 MAG: hypothetical protein B7Z76_08680 [Acidiphilium sp. 20-67-58]HQT60289.1 hypothetical protein [Acidiphilium sp.]HQU11829.1 hypothetical protein [Acidiphilium sp.]
MHRLTVAALRRALTRRGAAALALCLAGVAAVPGASAAAAPDLPTVRAPYGAYMAGAYAAQTGDQEAAAHYLGAALARDPGNAALASQAFLSAALAGRPDAARLAARLSGDPLAAMTLANAAVRRGDWKTAATRFASLPAEGLTGLVRPLLLAWCEAGDADYGAAIARLDRAAQAGAFASIDRLNAALIADMAGREAQAARLYAAAAATSAGPPSLRLAQALASFAARAGHPAQSRAILVALVAAHPDLGIALPALERAAATPVIGSAADGIAEAYLTLAGTINRRQDPLLRRLLLRFALHLRPGLAAARMLAADDNVQDKHPRAAAALLAAIPPDDPLYAPALLQRANILIGLGEGRNLLPALAALAKAHPHATEPLALAADIERAAGDNAAAIRLSTAAIARAGQPLPARAWSLFYARAIAEDHAGQWKPAEADLREALALSPGQPYVLNYLAYSWALRGERLAEAERMLRQALAVDPHEGAIIDSLGYVLLREGKLAEAMTTQIHAVHLAPDDAEVNAHLADIYAAAGHKLAAEHQWGRALSLHPDPKLRATIEARLKAVAAR